MHTYTYNKDKLGVTISTGVVVDSHYLDADPDPGYQNDADPHNTDFKYPVSKNRSSNCTVCVQLERVGY
jgi:hypothetical protein